MPPITIMPKFRVKEICREKGITMKDLAEGIGSSSSSLSQMINGYGISLRQLKKIADFLEVDIVDLIEREKPEIEKKVQGCVVFRHRLHVISCTKDLEDILEMIKKQS